MVAGDEAKAARRRGTDVLGPALRIPAPLEAAVAAHGELDASETVRLSVARSGAEAAVGPLPLVRVGEGEGADFEIRRLLGRGGMGQVLLAEQVALGREVAIKRPAAGRDTRGREALLREGMVTGQLEHPNVVPVHLMGIDDQGEPVVVMKRVEGVTWGALIADEQHPAWAGAKGWSEEPLMRHLAILLEISRALELAHSHGWVHRDVKPANVMVGARGEVYLVDWGIATEVGSPAYPKGAEMLPTGTPSYMAPEMVASEGVVDERTDVYLLGACLHEVITGAPPHRRPLLVGVLGAALASEPPRYDHRVAAELGAIARRAMARDPADRYPSVQALREALSDYVRHHDALRLTREGDRAAEALMRKLEALGDEPSGRELVEVHASFAEARFAYLSALQSWSRNPPAKQGLDGVLRAMIHHEITHGSLDAAEVLLAQLPEPDADLAHLLVERRGERQASAQRIEGLLSLERDLDPTIGRQQRLLFFLTAALAGAISVLLIVPWGGRAPIVPLEPRASIVLIAVVALGVGIASYVGRRWMLKTAVNRRIVAFMFLTMAGVAANRWVAGGEGVAPAMVVTTDLLIETVLGVAAALTVDRRLGWLAAGFGIGVVSSRLWPAHYVVVFLASNVLALGAGGAALARGDAGRRGSPGR